MPLEVLTLRAYEGPNAYGPQPGLLLRVRANNDRTRRLRDALKDGAQSIGLVLGFLDCEAEPLNERFVLTCHCATPQPGVAAELARYVVEGINRQLASDDEWDADGPLWELQKRRRREAAPLALLQLAAEARQRGLPLLRAPDGSTRIGYGAPGWGFDAGQLALGETVAPPWEQIGSAPVVAVGGAHAAATADLLAQRWQRQQVVVASNADFEATRAALCDPQAHTILLALQTASIVMCGTPIERCAISALTGTEPTPPSAWSRDEYLRALGVPMLLTQPTGRVLVNADEPELLQLAQHAPCPVILFSQQGATNTIRQHQARGGEALFVADDQIVVARGTQHVALAHFEGTHGVAALAARGVQWALDGT
jgi:hypothetical protein